LLSEINVSARDVASCDYSFGPFRLLPSRLLLLEGDRPLHIGNRALDILAALVERAGEIVSKEELIARVWPNTFVEEGNLRVHIAAIRKILGDGRAGNRYVANIPGRGYRFIAPVSISRAAPAAPQARAVEPAHNLPAPLTRMVGRAGIIASVVAELPRQRFITLVGAGGIGKTTVALAAAERVSASYADRVRFVDLAPLSDPNLVPSALASVLGVPILSDNPIPGLIAYLRDKQMLLVFDCCEHVVEVAATLVSELLKGAKGVHILATSREPLRAEGEYVHRLSPLDYPSTSARLTAAEALAFPAVQLFVERAAASLDEFELTDENAPLVAEICRRLDGIALAVELAASRVDAFSLRELAARLNDRFRLLTRGRRTALARHQTLGATLDWSYEFLPESERLVLRRLAVLAGNFQLEAACAIAADAKIDQTEVVDCVANLVAKSLVVADVGGPIVRYRLLDTMRAYALTKLTASGELKGVTRRHAEYFRDVFQRAAAEWETWPTSRWVQEYGHRIDNVRAALDWAFSADGDAGIGVELTVAAVLLWLQLSLMEECHRRVEQALAQLGNDENPVTRQHMQLLAALAVTLLHEVGPRPKIITTWTKVLELAESLDDRDYEARALWGLWVSNINGGEYRASLAFAERFRNLPANAADPTEVLIGDRLVGNSLYYLGDHTNARRLIAHMLSHYIPPVQRSHIVRFHFDPRAGASAILARVLWEQGFPDQALRAAHRGVTDAQTIDHALSLCIALAVGMCPVAIAIGDLERSERAVAMLLDYSTRYELAYWAGWARAFQGVLLIKRADPTGLQVLGSALHEKEPGASAARHHVAFLGDFAEALGRAGEIAKGFAAIDEAIERCERDEGRWCFAELLRVKGELFLQDGGPDARQSAGTYFLQSLDWATRQQTLSWELRTATSLARLRRDEGRIDEARDLLGPVYARFSEGFATVDLVTAKILLDELA
jgi:predicted ATPase/DNA-binding winged helix-turn-helix (wHTH) protein